MHEDGQRQRQNHDKHPGDAALALFAGIEVALEKAHIAG
jgi:hypothetical protein